VRGSNPFQCSSASRKFLNTRAGLNRPAEIDMFQCSSASRKFLNTFAIVRDALNDVGFSALQRAENSSMIVRARRKKFFKCVSVLFSEPKIPQYTRLRQTMYGEPEFQCSSASRKFLNLRRQHRISF